MSNVSQLESQLKLAKEQEKLAYENKEMQDLIKNYVGKCYGTRTFRQKAKATWNSSIYIEKIERYEEHKFATGAGTIVCTYKRIIFNNGVCWMDKTNESNKVSNYSRSSCTTNLNQDDRNMSSKIFDLIGRMKEIPKETFDVLFNCGNEIDAHIELCFSGKIQINPEKTIGDSTKQDVLIDGYKQLGIDYIDLESYPKLMYALRYSTLPAFFEDRFLIKDYAKKALELRIAQCRKDMSSPFTNMRCYEAKQKEIELIQEHIILLNL
jgi:hypothetical protein